MKYISREQCAIRRKNETVLLFLVVQIFTPLRYIFLSKILCTLYIIFESKLPVFHEQTLDT